MTTNCSSCRRPRGHVPSDSFFCSEQDGRECLLAQVSRLKDDNERLQVQLAGCGVAALGGTGDPQVARSEGPSSYGWSPAYQDVLDLRRKYDQLTGRASS